MMTPNQLRQTADAIEAKERGEEIEFFSKLDQKWVPTRSIDLDFPHRPKPKPAMRAWSKPDDVPGLCWIRRDARYNGALVLGLTDDTLITSELTELVEIPWSQVASCQYSTDRKTWFPCAVPA